MGSTLAQVWIFSGFNSTATWVVCITAMITYMISYIHSHYFDMKYLPWYSVSCYLLQDKDMTPKEVALQKGRTFSFHNYGGNTWCTWRVALGSRKGSAKHFWGESYRGNLWVASLSLCFYVCFYPPSLNCFLVFIFFNGKKLPTSVITFVNETDSIQRN